MRLTKAIYITVIVLFTSQSYGQINEIDSTAYHKIQEDIQDAMTAVFSTDRLAAENKLSEVEGFLKKNTEIAQAFPELELEWMVAKCWVYYETGLDTDPILEFLAKGNTRANQIIGTSKGADVAAAHLYDITGRCIITALGEVPKAKYYFYKALDLKFKHLPNWHPDVLVSRWNLIKMNSESYLKERHLLLEQNIKYLEKYGNTGHFYAGFNYLELAGVYREGDLGEGLSYPERVKKGILFYNKTLEVFKNSIGEKAYANSYALHGLARGYLELQNQELYNYYFQKNLEVKGQLIDPKSLYLEYLEAKISTALSVTESAKAIHKFLAFNYNGDTLDILSNPTPPAYFKDNFRYLNKGDALIHSMRRNGTFSLDTLRTAVDCVNIYIQQKENEIYDRYFQREVLENSNVEAQLMNVFEACFKAYELSGDIEWYNAGYKFLNFSKNFNLKVAEIKRTRNNLYAEKSSSIKAIEDSINLTTLNAYKLEVESVLKNMEKIASIYAKVFRFQSQKDSVLSEIESQIKKIETPSFETNFADLQSTLQPNQVFLEYAPLYSEKDWVLFMVTKDKINLKRLSNLTELTPSITTFREAIQKNEFSQYAELAFAFYQELIEPIAAEIEGKELLIVPNKALTYIPFGLLLSQKIEPKEGESVDYSQLPYLINNNTITYHYQSDLLFYQQERTKETPLSFAGFAPIAGEEAALFAKNNRQRSMVSDSTLSNLTEEEVNARLRSTEAITLPASAWEIAEITSKFVLGKALINGEATEEKFIEIADEHDILHIASHCIVDDEKPELSRLVFSSESKDDGFLYLYELMKLNLNSELVILSACNTGYGKIKAGEGIASIAYGFAHAGCPNIVMSQWAIYDDFSAKIITNFYKYLDEGKPKDRALQLAKLEFLQDPNIPNEFKQPYYWGGFQFVGDNAPVEFYKGENKLNIMLALGLVLILVATIVLFLKRRRSSN